MTGPSGFGPQIPPSSLPFTREPFLLHVRVRNSGGGSAPSLSGQMTLPPGLTYVGDSAISAGFQSSFANGVLTFSADTLAGGTTATFTVQVVTEVAATYTLVVGTVVMDPLNLVSESDEANNSLPRCGRYRSQSCP